mmetsp:Transcript_118211/g.341763  ORF Transcript_118211/g.341763 Transcript_118211/m.341763 type:complete len:211 (+) Transcript_118211:30-662(+)
MGAWKSGASTPGCIRTGTWRGARGAHPPNPVSFVPWFTVKACRPQESSSRRVCKKVWWKMSPRVFAAGPDMCRLNVFAYGSGFCTASAQTLRTAECSRSSGDGNVLKPSHFPRFSQIVRAIGGLAEKSMLLVNVCPKAASSPARRRSAIALAVLKQCFSTSEWFAHGGFFFARSCFGAEALSKFGTTSSALKRSGPFTTCRSKVSTWGTW